MESSENCLIVPKGTRFKFDDTQNNREYKTADNMKVPLEHFEGFLAEVVVTLGITGNKPLHTYHTLILGDYSKTSCGGGKETGRYFDGKLNLSPGIRYYQTQNSFENTFTNKVVTIIIQPNFTVSIPPGYYGAVLLWNKTDVTLLRLPQKKKPNKSLHQLLITPKISSNCLIIPKGTKFKFSNFEDTFRNFEDTFRNFKENNREYETAINIETRLKHFDGFLVEIVIQLNITGNKHLRTKHTMILGDYAETGELKETGRYFNETFVLPSGFPYCATDDVSKMLLTKCDNLITFQPKFKIIIPPGYYRNINLRDETKATFIEPPIIFNQNDRIMVNLGYRPTKQPERHSYRSAY